MKLLFFIISFSVSACQYPENKRIKQLKNSPLYVQEKSTVHKKRNLFLINNQAFIFKSIQDECVDNVKEWLSVNKNPNIKLFPNDNTPLMKAVEKNNLEIIRLLLINKSDITLRNAWNETAALKAIKMYKDLDTYRKPTLVEQISILIRVETIIRLLFTHNIHKVTSDYIYSTDHCESNIVIKNIIKQAKKFMRHCCAYHLKKTTPLPGDITRIISLMEYPI